jgi:tetratricopeptide (TPR) repeat protein
MTTRGTPTAAAVSAAAALAIASFSFGACDRSVEFPAPREAEPAAPARTAFVGAERCASCHGAQYAQWKQSTHGRAGGPPSAQTVIAPFAGVIRFANALVTPRIRGGVYEFVVQQDGEAPREFRVDGAVGAGHIFGGGTQGFVTELEDGTVRFLPFEWSRQQRQWFCNTNSRTGRGWAPITPAMRIEECGDWPPIRILGDTPRYANCQSCHASQATVDIDSAAHRYRTRLTSLAINCESCHGPAARHVQLAESGAIERSSDIGLVALATLDKTASVGVCYQCHALKDQLRDGFVSGATLESYYSLKFPLLGDRPLHPDGRIRTFAYQEGHSFSDCYLNGGMTCVSCHDPHDQKYRSFTGDALPGRFDDRQCTSCHLSKAERPQDHSKHPRADSGRAATSDARRTVSCTSCHMPFRQEPDTRPAASIYAGNPVVAYARSDHTISIPRPTVDSALGLASACSACHANLSVAQQEAQIRAWWGSLKPQKPETHPYARFANVGRFLEGITPDIELTPEQERELSDLARSRDADVRAAALATLHLAKGEQRTVRAGLAAALRAEGARDASLRARWALALGHMGDRYAAGGNLANAAIAYTRALEVRPSSARLLASLANAQRDAGNLTGAIASYQRSLALDARTPLTWVNFGIALAAAGDTTAAVRAYTNASTLDASEPLAWFNLGNVLLVRGDLDAAASMYERVVAADPSLALAHFQLARTSLLKRNERGALAHLRRGLAFDSSDTQARQMAELLTRRLTRTR